MKKVFFILLISLISCKKESKHKTDVAISTTTIKQHILTNPTGKTIKTRFNTPKGFHRVQPKEGSFQYYLQNFSLKPQDSKVHLYNGDLKNRQDVHQAILDISVGKRDLQQCADATMRLRAEYLYQKKQFDSIHFNFTNGFKATYSKWRLGKRIKVVGNTVTWYNGTQKGDSRKSFDKYLTMVFSYAGTLSLEKEMKKVIVKNMKIGDVFIQGGSPGHAVIIVDMAKNDKGEAVFLLAQSYMPAQEIHVLKNFNNQNISPWYSAENLETLMTPEWTFTKNNLRRFQ
ncbi:MAG: DUF4846 domain-containing protein [Flavobacteriaceae bacterium]|nr:DUF4846 domain-containing protein [Flavobacteriaceae bacterium]